MVRAWYMDNTVGCDQRAENQQTPPRPVTLDYLAKLGVEYFKFDVKQDYEGNLAKFRQIRGYNYQDEFEAGSEGDDDAKLQSMYTEHTHPDDEIRFVLEGSGYFDVRDQNDEWIRILVEPGDILVEPAGLYHRFTLDKKSYIRAIRLFTDHPVWTPYPRPEADKLEARQQFIQSLSKFTQSAEGIGRIPFSERLSHDNSDTVNFRT